MHQKEIWRKIFIRIEGTQKLVVAKYVTDFDPDGKLEIMKYGYKRYALVRSGTSEVVLQNCKRIVPVKNGITKYFDLRDCWGILDDRGQIICEAGVLKSSRPNNNTKK